MGIGTVDRFAGKIAVVTGASSGIGRATALRLASEGATVVALDIDERVAEVAKDMQAAHGRGTSVRLNCTDRAAVEAVFSDLLQKHDFIDILVNVVGRTAGEKRTEFYISEPETWDEVIDLSLMSTLICTRQVVPGMRERKRGKIVNIASAAFLSPTPTFADYAAAKAGVVGFTRVLAIELAPFGVNVNAISPGPITTPATEQRHTPEFRAKLVTTIPLGRYGDPRDVAGGVAFLASEEAAFITGHNLVISGGRAIG